jgi:hypothetical protein
LTLIQGRHRGLPLQACYGGVRPVRTGWTAAAGGWTLVISTENFDGATQRLETRPVSGYSVHSLIVFWC